MCTDCLDDADRPRAVDPHDVAGLARGIEAEMSGERVPSRAWAVYFGQASGALDWRMLERMARAMDGARLVASLAVTPGKTPHR